MSESTLPSGKVAEQEVRFSLVHGEVVSVDRLTDTHFETTPGSVMAFGNVVNVTSPTVSAYSKASKRVWVRKEDGTELSIAAPDSVETRAGHNVALMVVSGMHLGKPVHQWCAIVNHTTQRWDHLQHDAPVNPFGKWNTFWAIEFKKSGLVVAFFFIVMVWMVVWLVRLFLFGTNDGAAFFTNFIAAICVFIANLVWADNQSRDVLSVYREVLKRAAETALQVVHPMQSPATTGPRQVGRA